MIEYHGTVEGSASGDEIVAAWNAQDSYNGPKGLVTQHIMWSPYLGGLHLA